MINRGVISEMLNEVVIRQMNVNETEALAATPHICGFNLDSWGLKFS
jgi:hypothetical protein